MSVQVNASIPDNESFGSIGGFLLAIEITLFIALGLAHSAGDGAPIVEARFIWLVILFCAVIVNLLWPNPVTWLVFRHLSCFIFGMTIQNGTLLALFICFCTLLVERWRLKHKASDSHRRASYRHIRSSTVEPRSRVGDGAGPSGPGGDL